MSPYKVSVSCKNDLTNSEYVISASVSNAKSKLVNARKIRVMKQLFPNSKAFCVELARYTCTKCNSYYVLTRLDSYGQVVRVGGNLQRIKDCQIKAVEDCCMLYDLSLNSIL